MAGQYKLIVSDFDGTLRRSKGGISEGNVAAIKEYASKGGVFALCTGRMMSSILPYAKQLELDGLVVAYQGAQIQEIKSGKILRDIRIGNDGAITVCQFLENFGWHIHVYDGDDFYVNRDDLLKKLYEQVCGTKGIVTPLQISEVVREKKIAPQKIVVMCEPEKRDEIYNIVNKEFGTSYDVTSSSEYLVEVTERGCDKGSALAFLVDFYGIQREECIAIGDNYNDLPMIRYAGLGVAVENGVDALKKEADFLTKSCDDDGVAVVIRKFGLGGEE